MLKYEVEHPHGMVLKAYRNLNSDVISLLDTQGHVVKHVKKVLLVGNVDFKVRRAGFQRAYQAHLEGRKDKTPHAFVIGTVLAVDDEFYVLSGRNARYNPTLGKAHFFDANSADYLRYGVNAVVEAHPNKKSLIWYNVRYQFAAVNPSV